MFFKIFQNNFTFFLSSSNSFECTLLSKNKCQENNLRLYIATGYKLMSENSTFLKKKKRKVGQQEDVENMNKEIRTYIFDTFGTRYSWWIIVLSCLLTHIVPNINQRESLLTATAIYEHFSPVLCQWKGKLWFIHLPSFCNLSFFSLFKIFIWCFYKCKVKIANMDFNALIFMWVYILYRYNLPENLFSQK